MPTEPKRTIAASRIAKTTRERPEGSGFSRRRALTVMAGLGGAALAAPHLLGRAVAQSRPLVIGGKAFTEQYVLAEITKQLLEKNGVASQTRVGYSTTAIREAQLGGEVDLSWDYTWTGWAVHHGRDGYRPPDEILSELRRLDQPEGLVWLQRSDVNNTYALAINLDFAAESCIHSMPDLAQALRNGLRLRLASDQECHQREDCLLGAQNAYNFVFPTEDIEVMNVADTYEALRERRAEVAVVYTTDGKIPAYDLELLQDPESVFAEYFITPVARTDAVAQAPIVQDALNRIARALDTATSQDLHYRVDVVGQPVDQVARYFISAKGL
ncbi:MAG: glycine betaine ABC transporter substrate-binding protein [Pseudomonadota bacterium]